MSRAFMAYRVKKVGESFARSLQTVDLGVLPADGVLIRVAYASLNFKDALSATGHPGVTKKFPHTPGIDAAGHVAASSDLRFKEGDAVLVTGYDLGMDTPGGFGQMIRVPSAWVVPLPGGLDLRESMILGTAGITVGLCLNALHHHGITPERGPVIVTGASGGVGSVAVALLSKLGYEVAAGTGSEDAHGFLKELGAARIVDRLELSEPAPRPMLSGQWAAAVDGVGGTTLENAIKALKPRGVATVYGLVGGTGLSLTVYPFIMRGITVTGIDSEDCAMKERLDIWRKLAGPWKPDLIEKLATEIDLEGLDTAIDAILEGQTRGRIIVSLDRGADARGSKP